MPTYKDSRRMAEKLATNPAAFRGSGSGSAKARKIAAAQKIRALTKAGVKINPKRASKLTQAGMKSAKYR